MKRFLRRFAATHSHKDAEALSEQTEPFDTPDPGPGVAPWRAVAPKSLTGVQMPRLLFNNFDRRFMDLGEIALEGLVLYVYPGCPHTPSDGASGLEADALQHRTYTALRDRFAEVLPRGGVVALSSISPTQQFHLSPELAWNEQAAASFEHCLLSDEMFQLAEDLGLPTFQHEGETYYERLTLVARGGRIQRVFHPVTPGQDAHQALTWLQLH